MQLGISSEFHDQTLINIKDTSYFLWKFSNENSLTLNIRYANILKKTTDYRKFREKTAQDETIGFIFNREGKILLFNYPKLNNQYLPYTAAEGAGIFRSISRRSYI